MFKNIIANYVSKIWGIISVFFFVPFYIDVLGIESYALINFYSVILAIMFFADGGLSATLNREIARSSDKKYLGNMLYTMEKVYSVICLFIIIIVSCSSFFIASNWLTSDTISLVDLRVYISLIGIIVAFQLFTSFYSSGLMGLEKQVLSNGIQILSGIFRSALVLIPLYFYPTLLTFFIWQVFVTILFFFITRYNLWKFIRTNIPYKFEKNILKTVGSFASGMMLMAIISSLNTQIDKLVISNILSLKDFGYYSLAGILAQAPVLIVTPIALSFLPRIIKYTASSDKIELSKLFHILSFVISVLSSSMAMVIFLFTKDFALIWTHDTQISETIGNVTKVLLIGGVFLSFQFMPYHLAIANGHTRTNTNLGVASIIFIVPALIFFVNHYGLLGATYTWLFLNMFAYFYLGYFIITKFLKSEFKRWLIKDTLFPLILNILLGVLFYFLTLNLPKGYYILLYSTIICLTSLVLNLLVFNFLNPQFRISYHRLLAYLKVD
jgi:O-antigen/teichoic acid export membrane protein